VLGEVAFVEGGINGGGLSGSSKGKQGKRQRVTVSEVRIESSELAPGADRAET
jgi:hypothetical protein